ncbi:hypothetical protein ABZX72_29370 [Streptomyces cyaneofuscatus]|uniref:hypothetical protein n=1 Tax=Streptomyces cyaneofuscatus TaxID=66883 RepID=UPI0033AB10E4
MAAPGFTAPKKKAARKKPAGQAEQEWNGGAYGMPQPGRLIETPGACTTPRCGAKADTLDETAPALAGWTRAGVYGSREPDRVWCSGRCAAYGIALAELRLTITARRKAEAARKRQAASGKGPADA